MRYYSDTCPAVTLTAAIGASDATMQTTSPVHAFFGGFPFLLRLAAGTANEELVLVASGDGSGTPYAITRGQGTTTAKAHLAGEAVTHAVASVDFLDFRTHEDGGTPSGQVVTHAVNKPPSDGAKVWTWQNAAGTDLLSINTVNGRIGVVAGTPNSTLHVAGNISTAYSAVNAALTLGSGHSVVAASAAAPYSITLPSAVGISGREYLIEKVDNNANLITIATTSAQTINSSTTYTGLNAQWKYVRVVSTGANWIITGSN